jgi:hypothetical protein
MVLEIDPGRCEVSVVGVVQGMVYRFVVWVGFTL